MDTAAAPLASHPLALTCPPVLLGKPSTVCLVVSTVECVSVGERETFTHTTYKCTHTDTHTLTHTGALSLTHTQTHTHTQYKAKHTHTHTRTHARTHRDTHTHAHI